MILNKINTYLDEKGFRSIEVNVKGILIHYVVMNQDTYVVTVFDWRSGTEFTLDQYNNINKQIRHNFEKDNGKVIQILNIVCTNNLEFARNISMGENQWIIDVVNTKLIIYENQPGDYLGIRKDIEDFLLTPETNKTTEEHDLYEQQYQPSSMVGKSSVGKYFTKFNTLIIALNIIVFLIVDNGGSTISSNHLLEAGALYWPAVKYLNEYYRMITYMFLHSGLDHLFNNMLVLLFIGDNLERATGKGKYLIIYFGSGLVAGIASMGYNMLKSTNAVSVGASGAIFGVVGAMAYIVAINKGRLENISTRQMIMFVIFSLYGGLTSQGVDNAAHIGGLIAGALFAAILYRKPRKKQLNSF